MSGHTEKRTTAMWKLGFETGEKIANEFPYGTNPWADELRGQISRWREGGIWRPDGQLIDILEEYIAKGLHIELAHIAQTALGKAYHIMATIPVRQTDGSMKPNPHPTPFERGQ